MRTLILECEKHLCDGLVDASAIHLPWRNHNDEICKIPFDIALAMAKTNNLSLYLTHPNTAVRQLAEELKKR